MELLPTGRITRLDSSPRPPGARAVFVDGELECVVPAETVAELHLTVGQAAPDALRRQLRVAAERSEALEAALRLLGYRARSRVELARRLRRSGFSSEAIEAARNRCDELGYLDDGAFARAHVRDRLKFRPRGRRVLLAELRTKGVEEAEARRAIEEVFTDAEVDESRLADAVARKRLRSMTGIPTPVVRRRLTAFLARRGFPSATIRSTLQRLLSDSSAD